MTKQEKIREEVAKHFRPHALGDVQDDLSGYISCTGTMDLWRHQADELLEYLHSQGWVVLADDQRLPIPYIPVDANQNLDERFALGAKQQRDVLREAGFQRVILMGCSSE